MKAELIFNSDLHFEHMQWKNELLFWKDEIKSFQNRIKEILTRWTDERILAELGQYQHDFGKEEHKINDLIREIDDHESNISHHLENNEDCLDRVLIKSHEDFRFNLASERDIYNCLKTRFFKFLSRNL